METAGAIAELYRADLAKDYSSLPQEQASIKLVEAGPELFSMFKPKLREYTANALAERTVEVQTGALVSSVSPTRVTLKSGEELKAHTLVWGAGLQGNKLVQTLGLELQRGNRIGVGPDLALPEHPEVYALGDAAAIVDGKTEQVLPQLGSVALQSGEHAGEMIARRIAGKKTKPFKYRDKGTMATIGRGAAVVADDGRPHDDGKEGAGGLGRGASRVAADERGPCEGRRRLGRERVHASARRPDHRRKRLDDRDPRVRGRGSRPHPVRDDLDLPLPVRAADAGAGRRSWRSCRRSGTEPGTRPGCG